ncbi:MAG: TatD family hydrolase [Deltaproteobacteria bacterium]|nr:TatD family hydrolase [Deltaproteobacteria bacterium]
MLFDTHCHFDLLEDRSQWLEKCRVSGVRHFLVPGVEPCHWPQLGALVQTVSGMWAAPGVHPLAAGGWDSRTARDLEALLSQPWVVAVGEIGLDAQAEEARCGLPVQEMVLRAQLRLARDARLPVLIHCRRAWEKLVRILCEERASECGGIVHGFSGSVEMARICVDMGFAIGVGGALLRAGARRPLEVAKAVPEGMLVLETDAIGAWRGCSLVDVARRVAQLRGWSEEQTAELSTANALRILNLKE